MFCKETEDSLQNMLVKLTHLYFKRAFAALKETDIHPKQVPLLGLLSTQEGQSQREIPQALKISAPTVAVSIKRLEKSGILERRADEKDQRMSRIYLTEKGLGYALDFHQLIHGYFVDLQSALSPEDSTRIFQNISDATTAYYHKIKA